MTKWLQSLNITNIIDPYMGTRTTTAAAKISYLHVSVISQNKKSATLKA